MVINPVFVRLNGHQRQAGFFKIKTMIAVEHKGTLCYMVDATLVADGKRTVRVYFKEKICFWPKIHVDQISPGRWAVKCEFYDIMYSQDKFKKTVVAKAILRNAKRRRN